MVKAEEGGYWCLTTWTRQEEQKPVARADLWPKITKYPIKRVLESEALHNKHFSDVLVQQGSASSRGLVLLMDIIAGSSTIVQANCGIRPLDQSGFNARADKSILRFWSCGEHFKD
eukprot:3267083-Amphidinium_carterae.1